MFVCSFDNSRRVYCTLRSDNKKLAACDQQIETTWADITIPHVLLPVLSTGDSSFHAEAARVMSTGSAEEPNSWGYYASEIVDHLPKNRWMSIATKRASVTMPIIPSRATTPPSNVSGVYITVVRVWKAVRLTIRAQPTC